MTDWDLMTEYIHDAMYEVDKAHAATKRVRENTTAEALDNFLAQVQELTEKLTNLETVLNHQEAFALDEFADWLRRGVIDEAVKHPYTQRMLPEGMPQK